MSEPEPTTRADYFRRYWRSRGRPTRAEYDATRHRHPSLNCYKRHGCRCEGCRRWNAADVAYWAWRRSWDEAKLAHRRALSRARTARWRARQATGWRQ